MSLLLQRSAKLILISTTAASSTSSCMPTAASSASSCLPSFTPAQVSLPAQMTSSQPPAISVQLVWNPEVKSSSFSVRKNQSLLNPPPSLQTIPDSVPADVNLLLQKYSTILHTRDVLPKPTHSVEHIHTGSHPPIFAKSCRLDPQKLENAKAEFKRLESADIICRSKSPWASPFYMVPTKDRS